LLLESNLFDVLDIIKQIGINWNQ